MRQYKAILLDLFDTLVDLRIEEFPPVQVVGGERRSTSGVVYSALCETVDGIPFDDFHRAFITAYIEMEDLRKIDHREIQSEVRFTRLLNLVGVESPPSSLVERLVSVHMDEMFEIMKFPPARRDLLEALNRRYLVGIVSNFDHAPVVWRALKHYGLDTCCDSVIISAEVGWRKPHKEIFRRALSALDVRAADVLFVGDTPDADIVGPKSMGMDVVWLDHDGVELGAGIPPPDHRIRDLEELDSILLIDL
jgi:putative hydrolase of the HAD superfamily